MSEWILLVISSMLSGLTLIVLIAVGVMLTRRSRLANPVLPFEKSDPPLDNVFTRLTFAESLDPQRFMVTSRESALNHLNTLLASRAGDGVTLTVNSIKLLPSGTELTFSVSRRGQQLLDAGQAVLARDHTGQLLGSLKDATTGKIIENLRGVPSYTRMLGRLTNISAVVIGMAHLIAGADIANQLKQTDSKINMLLSYRRIDQLAEMERIYTAARELCSGPMKREKRWELWRLRGSLREMRFAWRHELQHLLNHIEDPREAPWVIRRLPPFQRNIERVIKERIMQGQLQLELIDYAMRLEQVLAVASDTVREFEDTLAGELCELQAVTNLLSTKSEFIEDKHQNLSVEAMVNSMTALIEQFRQLLPEGSESDDGPSPMRFLDSVPKSPLQDRGSRTFKFS